MAPAFMWMFLESLVKAWAGISMGSLKSVLKVFPFSTSVFYCIFFLPFAYILYFSVRVGMMLNASL